MKKIAVFLFAVMLFSVANTAFAQQRQKVEPINKPTQKTAKSSSDALIPQGSMMLGGSAGFTMQAADGNDFYIISFAPQFGYFVVDNLAIGAAVSVTKMKDIDPSFGIGPFVRYYLNNGLFLDRCVTSSNQCPVFLTMLPVLLRVLALVMLLF